VLSSFLPPDTSAEISFIREHMISWPLTCSEFYNLGLLIFRVYLSFPAHHLISLVRPTASFQKSVHSSAWKKGGGLRDVSRLRGKRAEFCGLYEEA